MRIGRYKVYYQDTLVAKVWSLEKAYQLIANMVACGYNQDDFDIIYSNLGLII